MFSLHAFVLYIGYKIVCHHSKRNIINENFSFFNQFQYLEKLICPSQASSKAQHLLKMGRTITMLHTVMLYYNWIDVYCNCVMLCHSNVCNINCVMYMYLCQLIYVSLTQIRNSSLFRGKRKARTREK